ncbi:MAG: carboxypeptidase regulatory-like domain-containing protein, partial [Vicinamibacteria bacterium]
MTQRFADAGLVIALSVSAFAQPLSPRPTATPASTRSMQPAAAPAVGVAAALKPEPIPRTQIAGVVLRPDGRPAQKAGVGFIALPNLGQPVIEPFVVTTDDLGAFRVETRGIRELNVRAYLPPFAPAIQSKVSGGQRLVLKLEAGSTVQGEVINASNSQPLVGADVELADWETSPYAEADPDFAITRAKTDARGRFILQGASPTGRSMVRVRSRGFATETQTTTTPVLKFRLIPGHDLAGRVVDASGRPIARASLSFRPELVSGPMVSATTGTTGKFDALGLRNVPYRVTATADGFAPALRDSISADQASIAITLDKSARLRGRMVDEEGQPLPGVVRLQSHEGISVSNLPGTLVSAQVAKDGVFELGSLRTGANIVQFAGLGYPSLQKTVDVALPGQIVDLGDVVFDGGLSIRGRTTEKGDIPVVGARISA